MTAARRAIAVVVVFALGAGLAPARADVQRALSAFKAGRYLEAASELQSIVDRSPGYADGYFLLGHCLLKMRRAADAEAEFRHAIEIDPSRHQYFLGLALAYKAEADWGRSVQAATEGLARARDPKDRFGLLAVRAVGWSGLGRWPDAARDLEQARRIRSEAGTCYLLGKSYAAMGAFAAAIPPLQDALAASPDDVSVQRLLAISFLRVAADETDPDRKRALYGQAFAVARRLAASHPDDVEALHLVGRGALGAGEAKLAVGLFLRVLSLDPRRCYAMVNLGRAYLSLGQWPDSEDYLRQAAACAPRLAAVYETMGNLYLRRGMTEQAASAFRRADEIEPRRPVAVRPPHRPEAPEPTPVRAPR